MMSSKCSLVFFLLFSLIISPSLSQQQPVMHPLAPQSMQVFRVTKPRPYSYDGGNGIYNMLPKGFIPPLAPQSTQVFHVTKPTPCNGIYNMLPKGFIPPPPLAPQSMQVFHVTKPRPCSYDGGNGIYNMLPKGFIPPSGSSSRHNDEPDLIVDQGYSLDVSKP